MSGNHHQKSSLNAQDRNELADLRAACARLARIHSYTELWTGLPGEPWTPVLTAFGEALAIRIADCILSESQAKAAWACMPSTDWQSPQVLTPENPPKIEVAPQSNGAAMEVRRLHGELGKRDEDIAVLKAKIGVLERQLGKQKAPRE